MKWEPHENPKRTEYVVELEREVERLRARIEHIGASHVEAIRLARIDAAERMRESILDRVDQFFYVRAYSHSLCAQIRALPLPGVELSADEGKRRYEEAGAALENVLDAERERDENRNEARRKGAEAMRESVAAWFDCNADGDCRCDDRLLAERIRALPLPGEEKP